MAQGDAFTLVPTEVVVIEPDYHNITTPAESMKKEYLNISATPTEVFLLKFRGLSNSDRESVLLAHYKDQYGDFASFSWQSVPTYVGSGSNITGRWVKGSLKMTPSGYLRFNCEILFEKAN